MNDGTVGTSFHALFAGGRLREKIPQLEPSLDSTTQLNSTQPEITDAGVWHLYVRIIINKTIL